MYLRIGVLCIDLFSFTAARMSNKLHNKLPWQRFGLSALELGDSGKTQFYTIRFDSIRFTHALLICYIAHMLLV